MAAGELGDGASGAGADAAGSQPVAAGLLVVGADWSSSCASSITSPCDPVPGSIDLGQYWATLYGILP